MERKYNKGKRGRPSVAETYFEFPGEYESYKGCYGNVANSEPSQRSTTNRIYMKIGLKIVKDASDQYPELKALFPPTKIFFGTMELEQVPRSGILEQLGRMKQQNGIPDEKIIEAASAAAISKQAGVSSKTIEKELRKLRITGELDGEIW